MYLRSGYRAYEATPHRIACPDGDHVVLHEEDPLPSQMRPRSVLLVHGLAGTHRSPYVRRVARKLALCGIRTFRLDMRGWGAGHATASNWSHAGRSEDIDVSLRWIRAKYPQTELLAIGFSLGANMLLKFLVESDEASPVNLCGAIAISPPIDLANCVKRLKHGILRLYDRFFARRLWRAYLRRCELPGVTQVPLLRQPRTLLDFDRDITVPLGGFASTDDYYTRCSTMTRLSSVTVPTRIVTAADDPIIPVELFHKATYSSSTQLQIVPHGGHLGFFATRTESALDAHGESLVGDRRWLDWRLLEWIRNFSP